MFPVENPRCPVVAGYVRGHTRIAYASEHSVRTVSTTLDLLIEAYRKRLDSGRPPCIVSLGFVVAVFESRWPRTGG
jgi:hypothetical protein